MFLPYLIVGIFLWDFTHQSGVHATIAGVLLALMIPHNTKMKKSLLIKLEHNLIPYVGFGIMPIFAFANAGVSLEGLTFSALQSGTIRNSCWSFFLENRLEYFYSPMQLSNLTTPHYLLKVIILVFMQYQF